MRRSLWGILLVMIPASLSARQAAVLPGLQKPHQIAVEGNNLYVFDEADYSLHVYTTSPLAPALTLGRKGNGPHDFQYLPFVVVRPESLVCTDFTKIIWFSRKGDVLRTMPFSALKDFDLGSEMLLVPAGDHFLRTTADHAQLKRRVYLLDSAFTTVRMLYEGPFVWMEGSRTDYRTDTVASGGLVFVADTFKGFYISVFDGNGMLVRTIDKNADVEEVPGRARLHQFCVSDGKIYATTYRKVDGKTGMIVLDLEGRIFKRLYLPLASIRPQRGCLRYDLFTVSHGKLYELVQNAAKGTWELVVTDLEGAGRPRAPEGDALRRRGYDRGMCGVGVPPLGRRATMRACTDDPRCAAAPRSSWQHSGWDAGPPRRSASRNPPQHPPRSSSSLPRPRSPPMTPPVRWPPSGPKSPSWPRA